MSLTQLVLSFLKSFSYDNVNFYLANDRTTREMVSFNSIDPHLIKLTINYNYSKSSKSYKGSFIISWIYYPSENQLATILLSALHKYKLSYILPILKLSSRTNTFETSELEVFSIKNLNSPKRSLIKEHRDLLFFSSNLKGNLISKKENSPCMDLVLKLFPTGLSNSNPKLKRLKNFIPKAFQETKLSEVLFTNHSKSSVNFQPSFNFQVGGLENSKITSQMIQDIFKIMLQSLTNCEFAQNDVKFERINEDQTLTFISKNKPMNTVLYEFGKKDVFEIAFISPIFEEFFE